MLDGPVLHVDVKGIETARWGLTFIRTRANLITPVNTVVVPIVTSVPRNGDKRTVRRDEW